jgi:hypothetical protein
MSEPMVSVCGDEADATAGKRIATPATKSLRANRSARRSKEAFKTDSSDETRDAQDISGLFREVRKI